MDFIALGNINSTQSKTFETKFQKSPCKIPAKQTWHKTGKRSQLELQQVFYCEQQPHAQVSKSQIFPLHAGLQEFKATAERFWNNREILSPVFERTLSPYPVNPPLFQVELARCLGTWNM